MGVGDATKGPMSAIDTYLRRNRDHVAGFDGADLPAPPAKRLAVVACMDARLDPVAALGLEPGDAHVIRNAGGIVTDDVLRSLAISQRMLGTREVMVIQHTQCGMQTFTSSELADTIEEEAGVRPPFDMGAFDDLEQNLRESVAYLAASPFLVHKDTVRGFVYEVETGRLREVR